MTAILNISCSDGVLDPGEECDEGPANAIDAACLPNCKLAVCGDALVRASFEQCDDGNPDNDDGCVDGCTLPTCGDAFVQGGVEACDDGNSDDTDGCRNTCVAAFCGDGVTQVGVEACDDGNGDDRDGCRNTCMAAFCGDGVARVGVEACDDGNSDDADSCRNTCVAAFCGDGVARSGVEACDDGNNVDTDACRNTCVVAFCGDGVRQAGVERCDDGNSVDTDTCRNGCLSPESCPMGSPPFVTRASVTVPAVFPPVVNSDCLLPFPPAVRLPGDITAPASSTRVYVDAINGSDSAAGDSPAGAWATLWHAVENAPANSVVQVAQGTYAEAELLVARDIIVKGGFSDDFASWDPDLYPSYFLGRLVLNHQRAGFAGFRMYGIAPVHAVPSYGGWYHELYAGKLVGNTILVDLVVPPGSDPYWWAIQAKPCLGVSLTMERNDIQVTGARTGGGNISYAWGVSFGGAESQKGDIGFAANRVCMDVTNANVHVALDGFGACYTGGYQPTAVVVNNVIEVPDSSAAFERAVEFSACGDADYHVRTSNNTILGQIQGTSLRPGTVTHWRFVNNIVYWPGGSPGLGGAIGMGTNTGTDDDVELTSYNNLVFGFPSNTIVPAPTTTSGDDLSGVATGATVFVDAASGDFRPNPSGPAVDTGLNVFDDPAYGTVSSDLFGPPRPASGPWSRGAIAP